MTREAIVTASHTIERAEEHAFDRGEAKGYKRGLLVGAREAEADADRFAIYEAAWIEAHNHARFRGASEEAQENIGRLLTWREAAATLRAQAARLRALAEKE